MAPSRPGRSSFQRALALSVGLHVCAALLIVATGAPFVGSGSAQSGGHEYETTRVSYLTIAHGVHARPNTRRAHSIEHAPAPVHAVVRVPDVVKPVSRRATPARVAVVLGRTPEGGHKLAAPLTISTARPERETAAGAVPIDAPSPVPSVHPSPMPSMSPAPLATATASPLPTKAAASEQIAARGLEVPPGGWGQSFERPLVADEAALDTLRSRYHASATVRVDVDDSGHATRVSLPASLPQDVRAELERRLLDLHYVPAECNGLRCTGTLQIIL